MGKLRQYPCGDRESEEREWRAEALKAQQHYRESISGALGALDKEPVLPEARHETPRSDIVGLLRRVSQVSERAPQYVLILRAVPIFAHVSSGRRRLGLRLHRILHITCQTCLAASE